MMHENLPNSCSPPGLLLRKVHRRIAVQGAAMTRLTIATIASVEMCIFPEGKFDRNSMRMLDIHTKDLRL